MKRQKPKQNTPEKISRVVVYLRVSTDEQADSGAGLDAQLHACRTYAERAGLDLVGPFADEGISGAATPEKRPKLLEAMAEIRPGSALLVAKRDRLGRDPIIVATIEATIKRAGGGVLSAAGEGTEGDSPTDVLMRRIIDAFAEFERLMIRLRTAAALASLKRRGRSYGSIPYGFRAIDDGRHSSTSIKANAPRPSALIPCPEEIAAIQRMAALRELGHSPRETGKILDREGIPTKSGRPWHHNTIRRLLAILEAAQDRKPEVTP